MWFASQASKYFLHAHQLHCEDSLLFFMLPKNAKYNRRNFQKILSHVSRCEKSVFMTTRQGMKQLVEFQGPLLA
jgi:hypothetical protein